MYNKGMQYIHGIEYTRLKMHFQCVFGVAFHRTIRALDAAAVGSNQNASNHRIVSRRRTWKEEEKLRTVALS